jgi:hypothetical protein
MTTGTFPDNWQIGKDFNPNDHLLNLKGKDYLGVQHRLLWFIRDQRTLITARLATVPYTVRTELVEHDRESGFAQFRTYVRDVLGNESTMYGSETKADFGDYVEKASTKSLGRALLALGYGTAFAPEMDEGERVVDSPVESRQVVQQQRAPTPIRQPVQSAPPEAKWDFLKDRKFRDVCNRLNYKTLDEVNRLVDAACGGPEVPVDREKVRAYVGQLLAKQKAGEPA